MKVKHVEDENITGTFHDVRVRCAVRDDGIDGMP